MGGDTYMEKVSTMALCSLTLQLSRKQNDFVKNKATVDAHWVCIITAYIVPMQIGIVGCIHTRVGFCVALLDEVGNARRLEEWDEQQVQQPTLFVYMYQVIHFNTSCPGSCETQRKVT